MAEVEENAPIVKVNPDTIKVNDIIKNTIKVIYHKSGNKVERVELVTGKVKNKDILLFEVHKIKRGC